MYSIVYNIDKDKERAGKLDKTEEVRNNMTRKELMNALKENNVKFNATMKTEELEKLYNENTKERENEEMKREETNEVVENKNDSFTLLKEILERLDITVLSETDRRITTSNVMYCKRANNKVRAYLKIKANDKLATEKNTQYKANVLLDLTDSHIDFAIRRMYR